MEQRSPSARSLPCRPCLSPLALRLAGAARCWAEQREGASLACTQALSCKAEEGGQMAVLRVAEQQNETARQGTGTSPLLRPAAAWLAVLQTPPVHPDRQLAEPYHLGHQA